ncbi:MAG: FmdB family zinc ribbon protein [Desulfonatronovibrionaceae bacterium]
MPIYEYRCSDCQQVFEEWQKGFEDQQKICPVCGGPSTRLISNSAFVLKGSGWYVTDYCNRNGASGNGDKKSQSSDNKSETSQKSSSADSGSSTTAASSDS